MARTPWGTRDIYREDSDGYIIAFGASASGLMIERAVPVLPGDDLTVAKEFYVGKLGFTVQWEESADGKTGIMGLARGSIELTIDCPMSGHGRNACVSLLVNSADAYYEEWRHKVDFKHPPKDETWDARTCGVTDPFGNTIFVIGPASQTGVSLR